MTPVERLRAFIADMLQWEVPFDKYRSAYDRNFRDAESASLKEQLIKEYRQRKEEANERLRAIFNEHLSVKALATVGRARLDTMGTCRPPEFLQEVLEDTESRKGQTVYIETFHEKFNERRRYAIVMENGVPKINAVYDWYNSEGRWDKRMSI